MTTEDYMPAELDVAALADCIAPLDWDARRAVQRYWDQVIHEEMRSAPASYEAEAA